MNGASHTQSQAEIRAIEYYLPERTLTTQDLAIEFPDWSVEKIDSKTGIAVRHIAAPEQCASDLAAAAAEKLFASGACARDQIDFLILCTQSPDYFLPTTACLLQHRLGIPTTAGAFDYNLGCSGYIYGLGLAQGLISSAQAVNVLLITAETYSKFMDPRNRGVRTIFGDGAAATLISASRELTPKIGPFIYGTDGGGGPDLIVRGGALRAASSPGVLRDIEGGQASVRNDTLYMNGTKMVDFTLRVIPRVIDSLLAKGSLTRDDIDLFVFHQANKYLLDQLRKTIGIPEEKFQIALAQSGNTVSSTIPIALKSAAEERRLRPGDRALLAGFGVGYSWGATLVRWSAI